MTGSKHNVNALVQEIRSRWRRRALLQGTALTLLVLLLSATALLLLYTTIGMKPPHLAIGGGIAAVLVLGVAVQFLARPLFRTISDQQIALFVEEKLPELEDRLNSAVEVEDAEVKEAHGMIINRLLDDAAQRTRALPLTTIVDRRRAQWLTYAAGACLVLFLVFGYTSLDKIRLTDGGLDLSALAEAAQPYLTVEPGNAEIEKGASQEIIAAFRDAPGGDVVLVYQEGDGDWQKVPMRKGLDEPVFLLEIPNIQAPVRYYVEAEERRSDPFLLSLYEFPEVQQIDVTYRFPDYTGLPPRTEEDTGDVRGLKGSTATLTIHATGAVETAALVLDDDRRIPLHDAGDGLFQGTITLDEEHFYSVRLADEQAKQNKFPDEYQIVPVEDERPYVVVTDPQRDVRANAIEEVLVATTVQDDYGVKDVRLKFSVNGEEEQTIRLKDDAAERPTETTGEHLFFLEDYQLQPGDVISYYVEAEDYFHEVPEATDMYFVEVIPFDQEFRQAANAGGMQGGQPSGLVLSQQQIIAATWKLHRERTEMDNAQVEADRRALAQAQANLKANIEERINSTAFSLELRASEENQQIVDHLRDAIEEMGKALVDLEADRLKQALTPERKALNHLLRADALNKEQQVAQNQGRGGGGGATEERMTELMDLELDISKDKYEMQQQRAQQQNRQVDEALERVRELARKQQNLANQNRLDELEGEERKRFIDKLKREQDELRQQTERLANQMRHQSRENDQLGRETQERLDRVAEDMREAEQALRRGDPQRAMTRQQQALNALKQLQRDLQMASADNAREQVEDLAQQFDRFREQEQQLARDIEQAANDANQRGGRADRETLEQLQQKREQMRRNLEDLVDQAETVEESVQQDDPELAKAIRNMIRQVQREQLAENMRDSEEAIEQGWLDYAQRLEEEIQHTIEKLETQRRGFDDTLPVTDEEQLARALDDVRDLMRQFEQMQAKNQQQGRQQNQQPGQQQGQQQNQEAQQNGNGQGSDRQARAEAAQRQRQLERAREAIDRLQRDLGGNPQAQQSLRQLESALARADHTGTLLDEEAAKTFFNDRVFDPLEQLELEIARQLDVIAMEKKLYGSRNGDVPTEYRELVEKYYEALSKGSGEN